MTTRWSVVAECQRSAAAWRQEQTLKCLRRTEAWPEDASVRRWAGSVAHRMGERAAARRHFDVALALEPTPEVRVHIAMCDPEATRTLPPSAAAWEGALIDGLRALRQNQGEKARDALEAALAGGAPPALVLPSLSKAAAAAGDRAGAESARHAFVSQPHFDPIIGEALRLGASS